ncbi:MAG TPA: hypothetical protein PLD37_01235 [Usitatibacteraceae bacterium]|nr:hypothetical protein [Usitatibacteraceae bacterium]
MKTPYPDSTAPAGYRPTRRLALWGAVLVASGLAAGLALTLWAKGGSGQGERAECERSQVIAMGATSAAKPKPAAFHFCKG